MVQTILRIRVSLPDSIEESKTMDVTTMAKKKKKRKGGKLFYKRRNQGHNIQTRVAL